MFNLTWQSCGIFGNRDLIMSSLISLNFIWNNLTWNGCGNCGKQACTMIYGWSGNCQLERKESLRCLKSENQKMKIKKIIVMPFDLLYLIKSKYRKFWQASFYHDLWAIANWNARKAFNASAHSWCLIFYLFKVGNIIESES